MISEDKKYLKRAVELARESVRQGGFPAGALIVKDEEVIAEEISIGASLNDPTSHAETAAIRKACQKLQTSDLSGATMYESIECCNMCFSVANWAGISKVVYACRKTPEMVAKHYYEGSTSNEVLNDKNNRKIELVFVPDLEEESLKVIKEWENIIERL